MIEFIDYEKRLTCEEHIVLLYYSLMYKKKHANYSEFQITELLIDEYNLDNNQEKRSEVEKMVERKKEDLDKFRVDYAQKIWDYEKPVIWSDRKKTDYYIEQLNKSHRFEVYVDYLFRQSGYDIGLFYGKNQQYRQGETAAGIGKDLSVMKHYMYPLKDTKVFLLFRIRTRKTLELTQY